MVNFTPFWTLRRGRGRRSGGRGATISSQPPSFPKNAAPPFVITSDFGEGEKRSRRGQFQGSVMISRPVSPLPSAHLSPSPIASWLAAVYARVLLSWSESSGTSDGEMCFDVANKQGQNGAR